MFKKYISDPLPLHNNPVLRPQAPPHRPGPASFKDKALPRVSCPQSHRPLRPTAPLLRTFAAPSPTFPNAPIVPLAEAPFAAPPHQLSPARSGCPRPFSPFSIWRRWLSRPGTALRCGSRSSAAAAAAGLSATAAMAVRPPLTVIAAGDRKSPHKCYFRLLSPETETEPPKQPGGYCHFEKGDPLGRVEGLGGHRTLGGDICDE